jgi:homoserine kinase type II
MEAEQTAHYNEIAEVLTHYDLGELLQYTQNTLGYNNTNFGIQTEKMGVKKEYFFRRYKADILPDEIIFEHAVIQHLLEQDVCQVAGLHKTRSGDTFFTSHSPDRGLPDVHYAVFDYLEGDDRYTWIDPHLSLEEVEGIAQVLARFHNAVAGYTPPGRRVEAKILDLLPEISTNLQRVKKESKGTPFDAVLAENLDFLQGQCDRMQDHCATLDWSSAPQVVIHCDFHPGNLLYSGQEVVGLFDFDWSKIDLRCFDVGLAVWYLSHWKGELDGIIRFQESLRFLQAYQDTLAGLQEISPLNEFELSQLPVMINLGNLFVLNWTVRDFYAIDADPHEYLVYLVHSIQFSRWFEARGWKVMEELLIPNL